MRIIIASALACAAAAVFLPAEARAGCPEPVIGCPTCSPPISPTPLVTDTSIRLQYDDKCSNESWTRVYGRKGTSGSFTLLRSDPAATGGWRTFDHAGLEPNTSYCYYVSSYSGGELFISNTHCVSTQPLTCGAPIIGSAEVAPFPERKPTSITVQYHDQCAGEDWTRIYARKGSFGTFSQIEYDGPTPGGWRTTKHENLEPSTTYCYYARTQVNGVQKSSSIKCTSTPAPACNPPVIGWLPDYAPFTQVVPDAITLQYHDQCGNEKTTAVYARPQSSSTWTAVHTEGTKSGWRTYQHSGLSPETTYCFVVANVGPDDYVSYSPESCMRTPIAFSQTSFTKTEADRVLAGFSWQGAGVTEEGPISSPYLYYVNLLLEDDTTAVMLRELGAHVQGTPIFAEEIDGFNESATVVYAADGSAIGRWYFAVLPGQMYNRLREESQLALARGDRAIVEAMALRRIPVAAGREFGSLYRLNYQYLGEQGFEHNEITHCFISNGEEVCQISQPLIGWLANKLVSFSANAFDTVREGVRNVLGSITRRVRGEVRLDVEFVVRNTDSAFFTFTPAGARDDVMRSGWSGTPLVPKGMTVRVRQGLASFAKTTDAQGRVSLLVAKNTSTRICLQMENEYIFMTELLIPKTVCFGNIGSLSGDTARTVVVQNDYVNALLQMTDAADYLRTVMQHDMPQVTVLVGSWADRVSRTGRAFAPCMGRMPNLPLGLAADLVGALASVVLPPAVFLTTAAEFLYSVDLVLPTDQDSSRGIATHEYGHVAMCSLMGTAAQIAWTEVILQSGSQTASDQASYIAEAFADFITSQVAGGTNYFSTSHYIRRDSVSYTDPDGAIDASGAPIELGLDENFTETTNESAFDGQVRRVASLMHDLFDGHSGPNAPNDGTHWRAVAFDTTPILHEGVSNATDANDEPIALDGKCMKTAFASWRSIGDTLAEDTFLRALAITAHRDGYTVDQICAVFRSHTDSATCPSWVQGISGTPGSNRCSSTSSGGGGSGGGSGGPSDGDDPPISNN